MILPDGSTARILALPVAQAPPGVASVSIADDPTQISDTPLIVPGNASTVTIVVAMHPADAVYVIIAVPAVMPITRPAGSIVAIEVAPELQEPPVVTQASVVVEPSHTSVVPVIAAGRAFTVIDFVAMQVAVSV